MVNERPVDIEQLLQLNQQLQTQARSEEWENFVPCVEAYLQKLKSFCEQELTSLDVLMTQRLEELLAQDALLMQYLNARLSTLSQSMTALRKTRHSAQAYNAV